MRRTFGGIDPDATITSQQMEHQLDGSDPLACVLFSHSPSVQVYYALRSRLECSTEAWLQEFVVLDGLDSLLDSLGHMTGSKFSGFSDAILQIDCLSCIRSVLNSRVGMDTLVNSNNGVRKLLKGLDLANALPRKHVLEILSTVCAYSKLAYRKLMDAMNKHRENHLYHRFSFIVNELKMAETIPHKTAVLTFLNAIICSESDRTKRCRIRNEFIGLTLLDVLSFLQREDRDEDLYIQLQVFQDKKYEDETALDLDSNLDLSSPQDLADAIQSRVFGGPKMVSFVNILQDLLAIEYSEKRKSDTLWHLLERHVHHIVHGMDDVTDLALLEEESVCQAVNTAAGLDKEVPTIGTHISHTKSSETEQSTQTVQQNALHCIRKCGQVLKTSSDSGYHGHEDKLCSSSCTKDGKDISSSDNCSPGNMKAFNIHSQELHSMDFFSTCHCQKKDNICETHKKKADIDYDERDMCKAMNTKPRQPSLYDNMTPTKNLFKKESMESAREDDGMNQNINNLNTEEDKVNCKMSVGTRFNFNDKSGDIVKMGEVKNRPYKIRGYGDNSRDHGESNGLPPHQHHSFLNYQQHRFAFPANAMKNLKWIKLDETTVGEFPHSLWSNIDACKLKIQPDFQQVEEMFREKYVFDESMETPLLTHKTRLSLNLFLNRLDEEPTELVRRLVRVDGPGLPLPFIKHLMEILPEHDEIKHLKYYNGNLLDLGQAEQFVLHLSDLPDYRILLTGQLRRAEFSVTVCRLQSVLASMLETSRLILSSEGLREIFILVLRLGNFLNHGQFNGYAGGYKLSSLTRLTEVKSREPGHNFVHFMVSLAENCDDHILAFLSQIPQLEKAASPTDIKTEFDKLNIQINSFVKQLSSAHPIIKDGFHGFLEEVKQTFRELQNQISELKLQSQQLAEYFCETEGFEIESCYRLLLDFFKQLRTCRQEARLMKKQKSLAIKQSNMFAQQLHSKHMALTFGQDAGASSSIMEERKQVVEHLLTELHRGNFKPNLTPPGPVLMPPIPKSASEATHSSPTRGSVPASGTTTPDRDLDPMELSHISVMGTPMMNRPSSEMFEEDLTITANKGPRMVTSSVSHLPHNTALPPAIMKKKNPPVMTIHSPLANSGSQRYRNHQRSRSDLAESINVTQKWIRYHQQAQQECMQAPLARPESSMTLATLNLETGRRHFSHEPQPMALVAGPTIELPLSEEGNDTDTETEPYEFVRNGKKGERKSGPLSNFFSKISRKVLRQRNSAEHGGKFALVSVENALDGDKMAYGENDGKYRGYTKTSSRGGSSGRMPHKGGNHNLKDDDKENVPNQINPFDRQKKNPIRLSNRFKGKLPK